MIGYYAANDGTIGGPHATTSQGVLQQCGGNIGNLAFWYGAKRLFDDEVRFIPWPTKALPQGLKAFVIPAANFIGAHAKLASITEMIRELDVPCVVIGLGAHAQNEDALPAVNESTIPFLQEISKRTPYVGVRGEYTARVCREFGISNVEVIGCPSVLISGNPNLGKVIAEKIDKLEPEIIAVHAVCPKAPLMNVERELVRYVQLHPGSAYVIQGPAGIVPIVYREEIKPETATGVGGVAKFLGFQKGADGLKQFLQRSGYVPTSIDSWSSFLRRFSCAVNTRIHGTLIALQTGVPSLCVHHDTRTKELSEYLKLPHLDITGFISNRYDIRQLFAAAKFDGAAFDERRREIAHKYLALFKQVGLTPSAHLLSFTRREADPVSRAA